MLPSPSWHRTDLRSSGQVDACVDAFLDADAFQRLPDVPREFLASGGGSLGGSVALW